MKHLCKTVVLIAFVALFTAGPAFTQNPSDEATPEAKPAAPVAYVYVQTHQGVNVYDAASNGKLTLVKGSPFATVGQLGGINSKYLISVGTTNIHAYAIESNGAVGKQTANVNTQNYSGSECGDTSPYGSPSTPNGSVLDHKGKYFYVQLYGDEGELANCTAWQTYQIEPNGELSFLSSSELGQWAFDFGNALKSTVPTISGNDEFGYGMIPTNGGPAFSGFAWTPSGVLDPDWEPTPIGPAGNPNGAWYYGPLLSKADPTNHLAVLMVSLNDPPYPNWGPYQLASYTINNATGDIVSTNSWENMPTPDIQSYVNTMSMSPSGKVLALAGYPGLQLFHFNGAAPITAYSSLLLPSINIDQLAWDKDNHLYALSYSSNEIYAYTVTPTSIKQVSGSPFKVENAYGESGLIVVPK